MRILLRLAILAVGAVGLFEMVGAAAAQQPIRIGALLPVTGPATKTGTENWTAMQIARDMINDRGGVPGHGRMIEYVFADIPSPTAAISEAGRVITKDGVKNTTGSGISPMAIPVSHAAARHGVLHWETAGAAEIITRRGHKYTFQDGQSARRYAEAAVYFTMEIMTKNL